MNKKGVDRMEIKSMILISVLCLLMVSGCNNNNSDGENVDNKGNEEEKIVEIQYQVSGEDPVILLHDLEGAGMDMLVDGTLKYDDNNKCLFIYDSTEDRMITPAWPKGTTTHFEDDLRGVDIPGYGTILEENDVSIAGGGIERSKVSEHEYPSECLDEDNIVVITPEN